MPKTLILAFLLLPVQLLAQSFDGNIVLGRATDDSITANILSYSRQDVYLEFGTNPGNYAYATEPVSLIEGESTEITLRGLSADTNYFYRLRFGGSQSSSDFLNSPEYSFHTQRARGSSFVFGVQGDSHPERAPRDFVAELYDVTLNQAKSDGVDMYFTTGDDFAIRADINARNRIAEENVAERYLIQRPHLGVVGNSAPVYLVNGNWEQAALYLYQDVANFPGADNPAVWAQNARNRYFPQPEPGDFYRGNSDELPFIDKGLSGSYFAFEWGDGLFVVIDPFWTSTSAVDNLFGVPPRSAETFKTQNKWDYGLGDAQYHWLKETLENSDAKFKFVFSHLLHGIERGGVEGLHLFEWGGEDFRGNYQFDEQRPGWEKPLHQLMVDNDVTIYFHAHDHVWAKQERDGVIYQEVSSPADPDYGELTNWAAYYTDDSTVLLANTGYTRVSVSSEEVVVDYVLTYLPEDENEDRQSGEVAYSYSIKARE